jgi:hypothetical protein
MDAIYLIPVLFVGVCLVLILVPFVKPFKKVQK